MLRMFNRIIDGICIFVKYLIAVLVAMAIAISFIEVVRRYIFNSVYVWSDEFIRYVLIYVGMVGGAAAYRYGQLVCFDSLLNRLNSRWKFVFGIASDLISLVLIGFCFYQSIKTITAKSVLVGISTGLKVPMTVPYFAFVLGFGLMLIFCIAQLVNRIFGFNGKTAPGKSENTEKERSKQA